MIYAGGGITTHYHFPSNHFSTFIEKSDVLVRTALGYNHMTIAEHMDVVSINNEKPMWMEVIHDTNVSNRMHFRYRDILFDEDLKQRFAVDVPKMSRNRLKLRIRALFNRPNNAIRVFRQYGLKKILRKVISEKG